MPTFSTPLPPSIPDTQLGLSAAEIQLLRRHQEVALSASSLPTAAASAHPHYAGSTSASRGRGTARASNASSRAASAASSNHGGGGRLLLDPGSLQILGSHFERLMGAIQKKVDSVRLSLQLKDQRDHSASTARFCLHCRSMEESITSFTCST